MDKNMPKQYSFICSLYYPYFGTIFMVKTRSTVKRKKIYSRNMKTSSDIEGVQFFEINSLLPPKKEMEMRLASLSQLDTKLVHNER